MTGVQTCALPSLFIFYFFNKYLDPPRLQENVGEYPKHGQEDSDLKYPHSKQIDNNTAIKIIDRGWKSNPRLEPAVKGSTSNQTEKFNILC